MIFPISTKLNPRDLSINVSCDQLSGLRCIVGKDQLVALRIRQRNRAHAASDGASNQVESS